MPSFITADGQLDLAELQRYQQPPEPFAPGHVLFWDDPHISAQMLAAHLDPTTAAASRQPAEIDRSVAWLMETLALHPGERILDLGCGPGLYAARLAAQGLHVTGVDYSRRSIDFATQYASEHDLAITYRYQNYLTLDEVGRYDVALLIYGDFCVLAPPQRQRLLHNIHQALRDNGCLVFDVSTRAHRKRYGRRTNWYTAERGFWKPGPHLVLEQGFDYPQASLYLDQYVVIEANGALTVYRNWFQDYDAATITAELTANGFAVHSLWGDLTGAPFTETSEWIGVVAQKTSLTG